MNLKQKSEALWVSLSIQQRQTLALMFVVSNNMLTQSARLKNIEFSTDHHAEFGYLDDHFQSFLESRIEKEGDRVTFCSLLANITVWGNLTADEQRARWLKPRGGNRLSECIVTLVCPLAQNHLVPP
ncbi:MAG: hypothetical protein WCO09_05240 [bacterium]